MTVSYISSHVEAALDRLAQQYRGAPNVEGLVRVLAGRVQRVEDQLRAVSEERLLFGDRAYGKQLDGIGALVGLPRSGVDDATYRVLILGQIGVNYADGSLASILRITKTIFQASSVWVTGPNTAGHARNEVNAELSLAVGSPKTAISLLPRLLKIVRAALPGGVTLVSVVKFDAKSALSCEGTQPWVSGAGEADGTGGGLIAEVLYQNPLA